MPPEGLTNLFLCENFEEKSFQVDGVGEVAGQLVQGGAAGEVGQVVLQGGAEQLVQGVGEVGLSGSTTRSVQS